MIGLNLSNFVVNSDDLSTGFGAEVNKLINYILNHTNLNILLIPHVLWKGQDDREISNVILRKYNSSRISVLNSDTLNYCELRYVISKCRFFIGARTHAVISAYSTYVPTIALGYSIKSKGIAKDLELNECLVINSKQVKILVLHKSSGNYWDGHAVRPGWVTPVLRWAGWLRCLLLLLPSGPRWSRPP